MSKTSKLSFKIGLNLSTALRATEALQPADKQIFNADFDYAMLPKTWRGLLLPGVRQLILGILEKSGIGTPGMLFCRTRYIDDALIGWLGEGLQQVVCLGAGNDNRAYRIPGIDQTRYFEVDLPVPQILKKEQMHKVLGGLPPHVTFTPVDFNSQELGAQLENAGFQSDISTFYILEGVTQYITADAVEALIGFAAKSLPGSCIVFTYIEKGIIDGTVRSSIDERIMKRVARRGMPWIFGLDRQQVDEWLQVRGFNVIDHADAAEFRKRYLEPNGRRMNIYEGERIILAEVIRATNQK